MFSLAFILFVIVGAVVLPEFGDDAVAELDGAVGLDAEFAGHLVRSIAFGHQLDSTAFVRVEDGGERFDVVAEHRRIVRVGEGVGHALVERNVEMGAMEKTQTREGTAAAPIDPQGFLQGMDVGADLFFVFPYTDITFLSQLGTITAVA